MNQVTEQTETWKEDGTRIKGVTIHPERDNSANSCEKFQKHEFRFNMTFCSMHI